ncbi:hypothetical protein ACF0H5_013930 [Mactra antiquata]
MSQNKEKRVQFDTEPRELSNRYYGRRCSMFARRPEVNSYKFSSPLNVATRVPKVNPECDIKDSKPLDEKISSKDHISENGHKSEKYVSQSRRRRKKSQDHDGISVDMYKSLLHATQRRVLQKWMDKKQRHENFDEVFISVDTHDEGNTCNMLFFEMHYNLL